MSDTNVRQKGRRIDRPVTDDRMKANFGGRPIKSGFGSSVPPEQPYAGFINQKQNNPFKDMVKK